MDPIVRNAIARIDIIQQGKSVSRGTGTLVTDRFVLTALHVVANRKADPPTPLPGTIHLTFPTHETDAVIQGTHFDGAYDWALLECATPPPNITPLPLGELSESGTAFVTYGFPDTQPVDGMVQTGKVVNEHAALFGTPAFQLFSEQAAAGNGAPVKGASGSPVIIDGALVGVLRFALMDKQQATRAGILYACPIGPIVERCGDLLPIPDPCRGLPGLPQRPLPPTPVRYLNRFTSEQAEVFFGRNRQIRELYDRLVSPESSGVVLLYGQTGVGKSSFLDAGVVPRLEWSRTVRYVRRDRQKPLIATLHATVSGEASETLSPETMAADLPRVWSLVEEQAGIPLVVIFDQLEEVYTQPGKHGPELESFMTAVASVFADQPRGVEGRLVLAFRKEWFPEIQKKLEVHKVEFDKVFLEGLDRDAIVEVVRGIVSTQRLRKHYGVRLHERLADIIADDLLVDRDSPIAPTLQILLSKLWDTATAENRSAPDFSVALYRKLSGDGLLLGDFLDQQLARLRSRDPDALDSGLAIDLLTQHTTGLLTSRQRSWHKIGAAYRHLPEKIGNLVDTMKELFLLVDPAGDRERDDSATRLTHDTLAPLIRVRYDQSDRPGQRARRIVESRGQEWTDDEDGAPLDAVDLAVVEQGLKGMRALEPREERLIAVSRDRRRRAERNRFVLRVAFAATFTAIVGLLIWSSYLLRENAIEQVLTELSNTTDDTRETLQTEPPFALAVAIGAIGKSLATQGATPLSELQVSLNNAMQRAREQDRIEHGSEVYSVAISRDVIMASGTADGTLQLWDLTGTKLSEPIHAHPGGVRAVAFSQSDDLIASAGDDDRVKVWRRDLSPVTELDGHVGRVWSVAFLDDHTLVSGGNDGVVHVWDLEAQETTAVWCHRDGDAPPCPASPSVRQVSVATDEESGHQIIVSGASDGTVAVWRGVFSEAQTVDGLLSFGSFDTRAGGVNSVDVERSGDSMLIVTGSEDGTVRVWHPSGEPHSDPARHHEGPVNSVEFDWTGSLIISGGDDQTVYVMGLDGELGAPPFQGIALSRKGRKCYPCLRNEVSPFSREGHHLVNRRPIARLRAEFARRPRLDQWLGCKFLANRSHLVVVADGFLQLDVNGIEVSVRGRDVTVPEESRT